MNSQTIGYRTSRPVGPGRTVLTALIFAGIAVTIGGTEVSATENELDFDFLAFAGESIVAQGFDCSDAEMGHTLYEDDVVAVLQISCSDGERYEVIDVPVAEDLIVVPLENIERDQYLETMDRYLLQGT